MKPRLVNSVRILISSKRKLIFPNTTVTVILSLFSSSLFLMVLVHLVPAFLVPMREEEQVKKEKGGGVWNDNVMTDAEELEYNTELQNPWIATAPSNPDHTYCKICAKWAVPRHILHNTRRTK